MTEYDSLPPDENGFSDLKPLLDAWGQSPEPAYQKLSQRYEFDLEATARGLRSAGVEVQNDVKAFEKELPALQAALEKKAGMWPSSFEPTAPTPNYVALRGLSQALAVAGQYYELQGRVARPVRYYTLGLRLPSRFAGRGDLVSETISLGMATISLTPLQRLLSSKPLANEQYRAVITAVESSGFRPQNFGQAMDNEYAGAMRSFQDLEKSSSQVVPGFIAHPYVRRNRNLYTNLHLEHRNSYCDFTRPLDGDRVQSKLDDLWLARFVQILFIYPERGRYQYALLLTRLEATRTVAGVLLYRRQRGEYPEKLEDLVPEVLIRPPHDFLAESSQLSYQRNGDSFTLQSRSAYLRKVGFEGDTLWFYPWKEPPRHTPSRKELYPRPRPKKIARPAPSP